MSASSHKFYEQLTPFSNFSEFHNVKLYQPLPADWCVIITDVEGSTKAIEQHQYKEVNSVGVASIVAMTNAVKPLKVPYVFGGDGATACFPVNVMDIVKPALIAAEKMSWEQFNLKLRIGIVSMTEIRNAGYDVQVGKYMPHIHYQQAMFLGDGLGYAEKLIKDPKPDNPHLIKGKLSLDNNIFEGFECRWNEIPSPLEENITLLVQAFAANTEQTDKIYAQVLEHVNKIYGDSSQHHPLSERNLSLTRSFRLLTVEVGIRTAFLSFWKRVCYMFNLQYLRLAGIWLMSRRVQQDNVKWGEYKHNLIVNTDYRKFDKLLRMVISGSEHQRHKLRAKLQQYHEHGEIAFGIHASKSSLITCIVTDYDRNHVHFLDGANGGYAMAAQELKQQVKHIKNIAG